MRDYGTVRTGLWFGRTMRALRGEPLAQLLPLYLVTSPHSNMIGVFHCPIAYLVEDLGSPFEATTAALQRLIDDGFCQYDFDQNWVFVHRMAEIQVIAELTEGDKRCKAVAREFAQIASEPLKSAFFAQYGLRYREAFKFCPPPWNRSL